MTPAEILEWVSASRAAQALPPTVEDTSVLRRVMALVVAGRDTGPHRGPGTLFVFTTTTSTAPTARKEGRRGSA